MTFFRNKARKKFGQHWLHDKNILQKIIHASELSARDRVLEIGPGQGSLTDFLLASEVAHVHAVEIYYLG